MVWLAILLAAPPDTVPGVQEHASATLIALHLDRAAVTLKASAQKVILVESLCDSYITIHIIHQPLPRCL